MPGKYPRTYRSKRPRKVILSILLSLLITFVVLWIILFFALQKYIAYTPDGLRLDIPLLYEQTTDEPSPS